jgi:hypothetical protein
MIIMNRQEREAELHNLLTTQRGKEEVLEILKKHAGVESGNLPPFGTLLVETILNYEFPGSSDDQERGASSSKPAEERLAPGDVKFNEPPGRESPGG